MICLPSELRADMGRRAQGTTLVTAILSLIVIVVALQLWLVTAALEAMLDGRIGILGPAALTQIGLFGVNLALVGFINRFDRDLTLESRRDGTEDRC